MRQLGIPTVVDRLVQQAILQILEPLLRIIRRFLQAGMMSHGVCIERHEGTPQGGPLSPILANLLLDDFDKELEKRGHHFCRYADDGNIYVRSRKAGERVMASVTAFLEGKLQLKVNRQKSAVAYVEERQFLGHRLLAGGKLGLAPKSLTRAKDRIRDINRRRPVPIGAGQYQSWTVWYFPSFHT